MSSGAPSLIGRPESGRRVGAGEGLERTWLMRCQAQQKGGRP